MLESGNKKISIIGPGNIGKSIGMACISKDLGDIAYLGRSAERLRGTVLELKPCIDGDQDITISTSTNPAILAGSDVVVITAGKPRTSDMTREDLIRVNTPIIRKCAQDISEHAPDAFVILVTNPLDSMVELMNRVSSVPSNKIMGMAGILDSRRFRAFLGEDFDNARPNEVKGYVIGQHGAKMVPLFSQATIKGRSLQEMLENGEITQERIEEIRKSTLGAGSSVIKFNGSSAYISPASCAATMIESLLVEGRERTMTASVHLQEDFHGVQGVSIGVPVILSQGGVSQISDLSLTADEHEAFLDAANDQMQQNQALDFEDDALAL